MEQQAYVFLYGVTAVDAEQLRSLLMKDERFKEKWSEISQKQRLPTSKWIKEKCVPTNVQWFRKRGEDSGANSVLTPASYNWDSCVSVVGLINVKAAKDMFITFELFFEDSICEHDSICINVFTEIIATDFH